MRMHCCVAAAALAGLLACDQPTRPELSTSGLSLQIEAAATAGLVSGTVLVRGATNKTVNVMPGSTVTIDGLTPGMYAVALEGFDSLGLARFFQTTVNVVANQNTSVTVTATQFAPFGVPVVTIPGSTSNGQIPVTFQSVSGAVSYIVQFGKDPTLAVSRDTTVTVTTTVNLSVLDYGLFYVQVRAVDSFGSRGHASTRSQSQVVLAFKSVSGGGLHSCGVTTAGLALCWGSNSQGQLGDGSTLDKTVPTVVGAGVVSPTAFNSVQAGGSHSCGLAPNGTAWCWGQNSHGQLGDATKTSRSAPTLVSGELKFASLEAGNEFTCGVTIQAAAYCWGFNGSGQLGVGDSTDRSTPTRVSGGLQFASLSAGLDHSCGLTTSGLPYCWGRNSFGELGDGTTTGKPVPTRLIGVSSFNSIRAGANHTCGVDRGTAYCWGANTHGEVGDGTFAPKTAPTPVSGGFAFDSVGTGNGFTCARTTSGSTRCWGYNAQGELGSGGAGVDNPTPQPVAGGLTFASISSGLLHSCAITTNSVTYCWGLNGSGELGDGTRVDKSAPARVSGT